MWGQCGATACREGQSRAGVEYGTSRYKREDTLEAGRGQIEECATGESLSLSRMEDCGRSWKGPAVKGSSYSIQVWLLVENICMRTRLPVGDRVQEGELGRVQVTQ